MLCSLGTKAGCGKVQSGEARMGDTRAGRDDDGKASAAFGGHASHSQQSFAAITPCGAPDRVTAVAAAARTGLTGVGGYGADPQ